MIHLAFLSMGITELLVIATVALLVFGGELPDVMRTIGRSYARLRNSINDVTRPVRDEMSRVDRQIAQEARAARQATRLTRDRAERGADPSISTTPASSSAARKGTEPTTQPDSSAAEHYPVDPTVTARRIDADESANIHPLTSPVDDDWDDEPPPV